MRTLRCAIRLASEYFMCTEIVLCMGKSPITISVSAGCVAPKATHSCEPLDVQFAWLVNTLCHGNASLYGQVSNYDQCISGLCRTQGNSFMRTLRCAIRLASEYFMSTEIVCMSKSPITISVSAGCVAH